MQRRLFLKQMAVGAALAAVGLPEFGIADTPFLDRDREHSSKFYLNGDRESGGCAVFSNRYNLHDRFPQPYPQ